MMKNTMARKLAAISHNLRELRDSVAIRPIGHLLCAAVLGFIGILGFGRLPAMGATMDLGAYPPDISAGFLNASYDATTGILRADGWPISFNISGTSTPDYPSIDGGQYVLEAQVSPSGALITGSLDVTGTIPDLASSGTLLTGQLAQFGFQPEGGNIFEFIFDVTGGDLAPYYHGETSVILDATGSGFTGNFANNFTAMPYLSIADNSAVPEPPTSILLLSALALGIFRRLRRMSPAR